MNSRLHVAGKACMAALLLVAMTGPAYAGETIPYEGQLDNNGEPINGRVWMEIAISPEGRTAVPCFGAPVVAETFDWLALPDNCYTTLPFPVDVVGGAFAVEIGGQFPGGILLPTADGSGSCGREDCSSTLLDSFQWVLGADAVSLSIRLVAVANVDSGNPWDAANLQVLAGTQRLVNRQRLGYALSNPSAEGFVVSGDLSVNGDVDVSNSMTVGVDLAVARALRSNHLGVGTAAPAGPGDLAVSSDLLAQRVCVDASCAGAGDITAGSDLIAAEDVRAGADLEATGYVLGRDLRAVDNQWGDGGTNGDDCAWYTSTSWLVERLCPEGRFVAGLEVQGPGAGDDFRIYCCDL